MQKRDSGPSHADPPQVNPVRADPFARGRKGLCFASARAVRGDGSDRPLRFSGYSNAGRHSSGETIVKSVVFGSKSRHPVQSKNIYGCLVDEKPVGVRHLRVR